MYTNVLALGKKRGMNSYDISLPVNLQNESSASLYFICIKSYTSFKFDDLILNLQFILKVSRKYKRSFPLVRPGDDRLQLHSNLNLWYSIYSIGVKNTRSYKNKSYGLYAGR